jgi:RimJ/RimL family protein N-acetyltransferase
MIVKAIDKKFWEKIVYWCSLEDFQLKSRLDKTPYTAEQIINEFAGYLTNPLCKLFQIEKDNELIGFTLITDLDFRNRRCKFHIEIPEKQNQNKSVGFKVLMWFIDYAFNQLNLNKIKTAVLNNNIETLQIMERLDKIGFKKEGILKEEYYFNGKYEDLHLFSLVRQDFKGGIKCQ